MYPGYFKNPVPPMYSIPRIMYPRVQAKTPEICKIPRVLWPAIYGSLRSLYYHYTPHDWAEKKKCQLYIRLTTVTYIITFIKSHQQGYRFIGYSDWTIMLKYLANSE